MRGKPRLRIRVGQPVGLIPAHAGKTPPAPTLAGRERAHPRACGENASISTMTRPAGGSSPRMRGKPSRRFVPWSLLGLIPAHAGKTRSQFLTAVMGTAHPRACGENSAYGPAKIARRGSSPRMRGKRIRGRRRGRLPGLIPAHAGKTLKTVTRRRPPAAHPRACGENAERSGVLALRSVRSWKTLSFPSSLKVTHCRAFVQLPFSRIRL